MKEFEISNDNKVLGKVKIYNEIDSVSNDIIGSKDNSMYNIISDNELQSYIISVTVNSEDELYDKISIYLKDKILEEIENIKKMNNIKHIKKNTTLDIIIPSIYLKKFDKNINNIDLVSLLCSKIDFVKKALIELDNKDLKVSLNNIIISFNNFKNSNEYEFLTNEEKGVKVKQYIIDIDNIIKTVENNTPYKFGRDFVTPIKVND